MVKHTNTLTKRLRNVTRSAAVVFVFALILQQTLPYVPQATYEARLLLTTKQNTLKETVQTRRQKRILARKILRSTLLKSANKQGLQSLLVADTRTLHPAALSGSSFPAFIHTVFPVIQVPNWGAMHSAAEWNRTYSEMTEKDYVPVPAYNLTTLTTPLNNLLIIPSMQNTEKITAKLFYSTRYFSSYDLDADEFSGRHAGVDLKLARGTPIGAIAGGLVIFAASDDEGLGLHVIIEHRLHNGDVYFSIYGHFDSVSVKAGDTVIPGQIIGTVGMSGNTTGPHLHLQIDRGDSSADHTPYAPLVAPTQQEAAKWSVNPIVFIQEHAGDNQ